MIDKKSTNFSDFYNDEENVSASDRAEIEADVELIGRAIENQNFKIVQLDTSHNKKIG